MFGGLKQVPYGSINRKTQEVGVLPPSTKFRRMDDVLSTLQRLIATESTETDDYDLTAFDFLTPAANGLHDTSKIWPLSDADLDALFASGPAPVNGTDAPDLAS
jgi:hypothetical protein